MEAAAQDCCPALQRELAECWLKVDDGTLVSNDGVTCCYRVTHATTRSWIETRCPGRFGVDVVAAEPEQRCAPCGSPPAGCH